MSGRAEDTRRHPLTADGRKTGSRGFHSRDRTHTMAERFCFNRVLWPPFNFAGVTYDAMGVTIHGDDGQDYHLADVGGYVDILSYVRTATSLIEAELRGTRMEIDELAPRRRSKGVDLWFTGSRHVGSVNEFVDQLLTRHRYQTWRGYP